MLTDVGLFLTHCVSGDCGLFFYSIDTNFLNLQSSSRYNNCFHSIKLRFALAQLCFVRSSTLGFIYYSLFVLRICSCVSTLKSVIRYNIYIFIEPFPSFRKCLSILVRERQSTVFVLNYIHFSDVRYFRLFMTVIQRLSSNLS